MVADALKDKVIKEFCDLIKYIKKGYHPDYEFILEEISFIDLIENNDIDNALIALQYYLNNKWQIHF